ncbi:sensor histidine kinase [Thiocapsa rosea]|uniref:sensor histidine kinase n=1 Tax=Thiocapsa rosea TaxID=69360 RepID=UPI001473070B|nr:HAMP domain-containing sensor histidine kinase [Thiocapsa rosea]
MFAGLLGLAMVAASLALWGTHEARQNLARIDLAHRSYEGYLSLSNHTYQLFKQFGDAMTIGDRDKGELETTLLAAIRHDITTIREIIAEEIHLDSDEMVTALDRLVGIETKIQNLLAEYQTVLDSDYPIPLVEEWGRLSKILDERVDRDFARLIQEALDVQVRELTEQRAILDARSRLNQLLAALVTAFGALAGAAVFWWLVRDFKRPVGNLIAGAEALARGDREHRIVSGGGGELEGVADALNRMADEIAAREQGLETSNKRLEKAVVERTADLERLLATLKDAEASRRRLLADVSHELRTPLTIIRGEADIALRGVDRPSTEYREALTRCRDAATHTARLVDDLLFIARRESRETRLIARVLDLTTFLPAVLADCRSLLENHGGSAMLLSEVDQALLRADPDRLRQVILILLDNAMRYGDGQVAIRLERIPDGYRISFTDTGPGLGPEDLAQVFQRFFRGSNAARGYESGVGLGLPVAKAIVEAHEGRIGVESRPGEGMTVRVDLPAEIPLSVAP